MLFLSIHGKGILDVRKSGKIIPTVDGPAKSCTTNLWWFFQPQQNPWEKLTVNSRHLYIMNSELMAWWLFWERERENWENCCRISRSPIHRWRPKRTDGLEMGNCRQVPASCCWRSPSEGRVPGALGRQAQLMDWMDFSRSKMEEDIQRNPKIMRFISGKKMEFGVYMSLHIVYPHKSMINIDAPCHHAMLSRDMKGQWWQATCGIWDVGPIRAPFFFVDVSENGVLKKNTNWIILNPLVWRCSQLHSGKHTKNYWKWP